MTRVPEIYTAAIGLYGLWLIIRLASAVVHYISLGIKTFADQIQIWMIQVGGVNILTLQVSPVMVFSLPNWIWVRLLSPLTIHVTYHTSHSHLPFTHTYTHTTHTTHTHTHTPHIPHTTHTHQSLKCVVAGFLLFVVIPLLLGHLVDLLLITPLRVPTDRTPIFYPSTVSFSLRRSPLPITHVEPLTHTEQFTHMEPFRSTLHSHPH